MDLKSGNESMSKRRVTAMIDEADISRLEQIAQQQRVSLAWVIRDAVADYLADKTRKDGGTPESGHESRVN